MADHGALVNDIYLDVALSGGAEGVDQNALGVGDLEDASLSVIPKEDLGVPVGIPRILGRDVTARFEDDETAVTACTSLVPTNFNPFSPSATATQSPSLTRVVPSL